MPLVSDLTLVAAKGSGFAEVAGPELLPLAALAGLSMLTAVVAASGLGFSASLSGALWLPTGLLPTPETFVLPRGFGWNGEEQNASRPSAPSCVSAPPRLDLEA